MGLGVTKSRIELNHIRPMVKTLCRNVGTQVIFSRFLMCSMKISKFMMNQGIKCLHTTDTRCITMHGIDCSVVKINHMPLLLTDCQEFK